MGCSGSRPVVPIGEENKDALRETATDGGRTIKEIKESLKRPEVSNAVAEAVVNVVDFVDEASSALDSVMNVCTPEAIASFSQALQDNPGELRDVLTAIVGATATVISTAACMTPAAVLVAPALAAVRALTAQLKLLRENKELAESLHAELCFADTLLLHAGRSEPLAKDHAPLLNIICGTARNASALIERISRRNTFMSFISAGSDGAVLRNALSELHRRVQALGAAAAVAGAMGISELNTSIVEKVGGGCRGMELGKAQILLPSFAQSAATCCLARGKGQQSRRDRR